MKSKNHNESTKVTNICLFRVLIVLLFLMVFMLSFILIKGIYNLTKDNSSDGDATDVADIVEEQNLDSDEQSEEEESVTIPDAIDFQGIVDEWSNNTSGKHSVLIYDIERDEIVGQNNINEKYNTASLYKLFVVYEGYRRIANKTLDKDEVIINSTKQTLSQCLDLAIRESNSTCAETIWRMIGHAELDQIIEKDFDIHDSNISALISTPGDILKIMKMFYTHNDFNEEVLVSTMKDSFLNQPVTNYNWRQGLPSGFKVANVYNKVGWDWNGKSWNVYHDAAIVEFPEDDRHFIVVVMSSQVPYQKIRELGEMIENQYVLKN